MHLKSLTLRGFKSFASATTLEFEPGITCVVGPNGSGKSNVVDAIAWVMGEQGAKSLRGGKMEDVIFAGTADKAPLGRAEVMLTIDNADGALPIDFSEVTISRTLFRTGGSEYAINGEPCRLLDVQELLSDSGIGREMHVIVGQGRLGAILDATPEDRRGYIEEAAGVLKHRKRKEKALRKLEAMGANLTRLQDLTHELRRQLKPLGKQAEVARRAQVIQTDVRDARLRLLADDLVTLRDTLNKEEADEAMLRERRTKLDSELATATAREATLESESVNDAEALAQANELNTRLTALGERYRGLISLAQERAAHLHDDEAAPQGADPDQLEAAADAAQAEAEKIGSELSELLTRLSDAETAASTADRQLHEATEAAKQRQARIASHREHGVRLEGARQSAAAKVESREAEIARLADSLQEVTTRIETFRAELAELEGDGSVDDGLQELAQALEASLAARSEIEGKLESSRREHETAQRELAGLIARLEALELSVDKGAVALFADHGLAALGSVSDGIRIEPGYETAIEAAVDWFAQVDAVAVADMAGAIAAVEHLAEIKAGQATILVASQSCGANRAWQIPSTARAATDLIRTSDEPHAAAVCAAIKNLLVDVVVVDDRAQVQSVLEAEPSAVVATRTGDVFTSTVVRGGHEGAGRLAIANAIEQTTFDRDNLKAIVEQSRTVVERLRAELDQAKVATKSAREAFDAAKSTANKHSSALALAASKRDSAQAELNRTQAALQNAETSLVNDRETLATAEAKVAEHATNTPDPVDAAADQAELEQLREAVMTARRAETESRLAVRTAEERQSANLARAKELRATAASEREARAAALEAARERKRQAEIAVEVLEVAKQALIVLEHARSEASSERDTVTARVQSHNAELASLRVGIRELNEQIAQLTNDVHRDEVARAEQRMRVQQLEDKALEEYGVNGEELLAEYGPDVLVPPSAVAPGDEVDPDGPQAQPYPFVRAEQEKRLKTAERAMNLLGKVNPLALEEFAAMEERYTFLNNQLEDLKASRKDLLDIVEEVDERIQQVFAEAFEDVQREFKGIFGRLFPGGEGRLVLTNPDDLLTTGVEVEARPPGKKVKRLSLLSGGERSLTTVAFLVALFKARPSPFYIMDEVEAALDDVNLGRLIGLMEELRGTSQLLIITHQKRTMEIADALYGVTMRSGVTQVISQRMREMKEASVVGAEELVDAG